MEAALQARPLLAGVFAFTCACIPAGHEKADAGASDAGAAFVEAAHPAPPQAISDGGVILKAPHFVPIFFTGDDANLESQMSQFEARIGQSDYWSQTTAEYDVGEATAANPIVLDQSPAAALEESEIASWLRQEIDNADPALPAPDAETVYVLHYPAGVAISGANGIGCSDFNAYHASVVVQSGTSVPYIVLPRCHDNQDIGGLTNPASHELIEAATDPVPPRGYYDVDPDHEFWSIPWKGAEIADMCEHEWIVSAVFGDFPYLVQRSWSNSTAAAGHDPCVPHIPGNVYFNTAPELNDWITFHDASGAPHTGLGVAVPVGCTVQIALDLFSDADTGGPWDVNVVDGPLFNGGTSTLMLSQDAVQGQNGDRIHLTITTLSANSSNAETFVVQSALGLQIHNWVGLVDETPGACAK
jgi:hypothetical protein